MWLRQRVAHVLVGLGEQLLLLVRAGQRVAAVVGAHVEGGVHRVGEVSGLWGKSPSFVTIRSIPIFLIRLSVCFCNVLPHSKPVLPCRGPKRSPSRGAPRRRRRGLLRRSCKRGSRSPRSWPRLSFGGAGIPSLCRQTTELVRARKRTVDQSNRQRSGQEPMQHSRHDHGNLYFQGSQMSF